MSPKVLEARRLTYRFSDCRDVIPDLIHNDLVISNDLDKAEIFNGKFSCPQSNAPTLSTREAADPPVVFDIIFTPQEISSKLQSLNVQKSSEPDRIPNIFLKGCCYSLADPLCHLFNLLLASGCLPSDWKHALVVPVSKRKGSRGKKRLPIKPQELHACFVTLMYRKSHGKPNERRTDGSNNLIHQNQYGFLKGHSTSDQISVLHFLWTRAHSMKSVDCSGISGPEKCASRCAALGSAPRVWHTRSAARLAFKLP